MSHGKRRPNGNCKTEEKSFEQSGIHSCLFKTLLLSINHPRTASWLSKENELCILVAKLRIFGSAQDFKVSKPREVFRNQTQTTEAWAVLRTPELLINYSQVINVKWTLKARYFSAITVLFIFIYPVVSINFYSIKSFLVLIACN